MTDPGKCWYSIRVTKRHVKPCGLDARLFRVRRPDERDGCSGSNTTPGPTCHMYLCVNHRQKVADAGYVLELDDPKPSPSISLDNPPPPAA